jgi:predicted ATP-dependent endonuclease of OLD family
MFTQLRIQNFKSWADTGDFRMAPLTGFFGANSSGKTAILQFLLMLKQTVESSDQQRILHLGGDQYSYVDLGTNYDIIHKRLLPEKVKYSLAWIPNSLKKLSLSFQDILEFRDMLEGRETLESRSFDSENITENMLSLQFESVINIDIDQISVESFKYSFNVEENQWNHIGVSISNPDNEKPIYQLLTEGAFLQNLERKSNRSQEKPRDVFKLLKNYGIEVFQVISALPLAALAQTYEDLFQNTY